VKRFLTVAGVAVFVAGCLVAGVWQLTRLADRKAFNAALVARGDLPVADIAAVLDDDGEQAAYRRVTARGTYDPVRELVLLSRSYRGLSGHHAVTPLVLEDGRVVLVDRGWVPLIMDEPPLTEAPPPRGPVVVRGVLQPSVERGRFGPQETGDGPRAQVFRIDVDLLAPRFTEEVVPLWMHLEAQDPPTLSEYPVILEPPELSEGAHLAYAIQWFLFATAATITAVAAARARRRGGR
jgi:cytochrome oxidase assembly protein ShyY1